MNAPRPTKVKTTTRTVVLQEFAGLDGVDITVYQGQNGAWHGDVLLDPQLWREGDLPVHCVAGSARTEARSGRWWYDLTGSELDFPKDQRAEITGDQMLGALRKKLVGLIVQLAHPTMAAYVNRLPAKKHWNPER